MKDPSRANKKLIDENALLKQRIQELEQSESGRKLAEEALRESEYKYRKLIETTDTGYVIIDQDGLVFDANPEYVRLTGHHGLNEILGRSVMEWTADSEKEINAEAIKVCFEQKFIKNLEINYLDSKGNVTPIELNATCMEIDGKIQTLTICRDITERKRAEEELQEANQKLKLHFEQTPMAVIEWDLDFRVTRWNPAAQTIFGFSPEEAVGSHSSFIVPEAFHHCVVQVWKDSMKMSGRKRIIAKNTRKDGMKILCEWHNTLLIDKRGTVKGVASIAQDITERKRTDQEFSMLARIGREISSSLNIGEVYEQFCNQTRKLIPFDRLAMTLIERPLTENTRISYVFGMDIPGRMQGDELPFKGSLIEGIARTRTALLVQSDDKGEIIERYPLLLPVIEAGINSLMAVPLIFRNEVIGIMHIQSKKPHTYTDRDLALAEKIGLQVSGAIANAKMFNDIKDTEQKLRESEEKYRSLFSNERTAIYIFEPETLRLLDVNEAFIKLYGYSREELLGGMRLTDVSAEPDDSASAVRKAVNKGTVFIPLRWHRKKNGTVFPIEIVGGGFVWKSQQVLFGITQDISERKRTEEELAILSRIGREINSSLNIGEVYEQFCIETRKLIPADRLVLNLITRPQAETVMVSYVFGFDIPGRMPGDSFPLKGSLIEEIIKTGTSLCLQSEDEGEILRRFPILLPIFEAGIHSLMVIPLISRDEVIGVLLFESKLKMAYTPKDLNLAERTVGQVAGAIVNAQMLNALQKTEHDLRESEEKYRIIFNNERAAIYIFELEALRYIDCNDACAKLYGYSREELLDKTLFDISAEPEKTAAAFKIANGSGTIFIPLRWHRKKDGTVFPVEIIGGPYVWKDRRVMFCIAQDITDRRKAEEKLQASLLEKETMLKEIHHRVKNNLQVISSLLGLQSSHLQDETAKEAFRESISRVKAMAMVHSHLYQSENLARVDFGHFAQELIGNIKQSYGNGRFSLEINMDIRDIILDIETSIPCGLIINELVSNAMKHAFPEGGEGRIDIRMQSEENRMVLTVCDNGIGFPESVDLANSKSLGLKLVNILAGQMKGRIDMKVDGGTGWAITFPVKR